MQQLLRCASGHIWEPGSSADCPRCGLAPLPLPSDATVDMLAPTPPSPAPSRPAFDSEVMGGLPAPLSPLKAREVPDAAHAAHAAHAGTVASLSVLSIPGYELIREIGRGGMGVVYQAKQLKLNRTVAVKMILSGLHAGQGDLDRFHREAEAVAALSHPNIVRIFEIGETDGQPWLAFEYLEGGTLAHYIDGAAWPTREAAELCEQLARGVQAAHDRGIIHRDLKPGNILFAAPGRIIGGRDLPPKDSRTGEFLLRISDFGLAKRLDPDSFSDLDGRATGSPIAPLSPVTTGPRTRTGAIIGTPSYISPEQAAGRVRDLGPPADIYATGAILYELLTGRPPFEGETPMDIVLKVIGEDPVPPSQVVEGVPRDLETICLKCLAKLPSRRYPSAQAVADDLRRWLDHQPITARPVGRAERAMKLVRRHPAASATVIAGMLSLVVVAAVSLYFVVALRQEANKLRAQQKVSEERRVESEKSRMDAERSTILARDKMVEAEESRRGLERGSYALLMAQVSALAERDPVRARDLMTQSRGQADLQDFCWKYLFRSTQREQRSVADPARRRIYAISWSADGRYLALGGAGDVVRILDPASLRELALLPGHSRDVYCLSFSPDGTTLATGDGRDSVRLWTVPENLTGRPGPPVNLEGARRLDGHRGIVRSLCWSAGGSRLASGGDDGFVRVWQIAPSFRAAGLLAGAGAEPLYRKTTRNLPVRLLTEERVSTRAVWCVSFAREGFRLAIGGEDGILRFWDLDQRVAGLRAVQAGGPIRALAWSPLEDVLAVVRISSREEDHSIRLVRPVGTTGEVRETARLRGHTGDIYALAFSGDGAFLASGSSDRTIRVWDVDTRLERLTLRGHSDSVLALAFSPDEQRLLVTAGADFRTRVWETAPQRDPTIENELRDPIALATLSPEGRYLAVADARGNVLLLRPQSSQRLRERMPFLLPLQTFKGEVTKLLFGPDEKTLYAVSGTKVVSWDLSRSVARERPETLEMPKAIRGAGLCADGSKLWLCGDFGFGIRDAKTLKPLGELVLTTPVTSFAVSADETLLAVGTGTLLRLYDLTSGQIRVPTYILTADVLRLMAFVPKLGDAGGPPDSRWRLVTTGDTGVVEVHEIASAEDKAHPEYLKALAVARSSGHAEPVLAMAFSRDGKTLVTAGRDHTLKLRDPLTVQERMTLSGHGDAVVCAGFVRGDSALVSLSRDGLIRVWRGDPPVRSE